MIINSIKEITRLQQAEEESKGPLPKLGGNAVAQKEYIEEIPEADAQDELKPDTESFKPMTLLDDADDDDEVVQQPNNP